MGLMDRISEGFGRLGKAAGQALDETRIQMDLMRVRRRKDAAARDLGYLVFRVTQGATAIAGEQDALVQRIVDIEKEIDRLEAELRRVRAESRGVPPPEPPPASPPPPPPAGSAGPTAPETPSGAPEASATKE